MINLHMFRIPLGTNQIIFYPILKGFNMNNPECNSGLFMLNPFRIEGLSCYKKGIKQKLFLIHPSV